MHIAPLGDCAAVITLDCEVNEHTHRRVRAIHEHLQRMPVPGQIESVPGMASVVVHYDPARIALPRPDSLAFEIVAAALETAAADAGPSDVPTRRTVEIPVCYGGELGPDLQDVARAHDMTPEDVVRVHSDAEYLVYMLGFLPGFPYLGGLPTTLATPRLATPRTLVLAGSVGIGGAQTGVYSMDSPGGWNIIGRTPTVLFSPSREPPTLLHVGDAVRFRPIDRDAFDRATRERE